MQNTDAIDAARVSPTSKTAAKTATPKPSARMTRREFLKRAGKGALVAAAIGSGALAVPLAASTPPPPAIAARPPIETVPVLILDYVRTEAELARERGREEAVGTDFGSLRDVRASARLYADRRVALLIAALRPETVRDADRLLRIVGRRLHGQARNAYLRGCVDGLNHLRAGAA